LDHLADILKIIFTIFKTPEGAMTVGACAALAYAARLGIKRMKRLENELANVRTDFEIAVLECRSDAAIDSSATETIRMLYIELRGVLLSMSGGKRAVPPEYHIIDGNYQQWRRERHDERTRRVNRAQDSINRAREQLAAENGKEDK
jgi:hypothetical protein